MLTYYNMYVRKYTHVSTYSRTSSYECTYVLIHMLPPPDPPPPAHALRGRGITYFGVPNALFEERSDPDHEGAHCCSGLFGRGEKSPWRTSFGSAYIGCEITRMTGSFARPTHACSEKMSPGVVGKQSNTTETKSVFLEKGWGKPENTCYLRCFDRNTWG